MIGKLMKHNYTIALAGNPNCGKSTIFNGLTGANQHIGNYPGVTVEKKDGEYSFNNSKFRVIDLPGTYTLNTNSPEEVIARKELFEGEIDLVVNVIDASNFERNMYLTLQLLELGVPVLLVLNMIDAAKKKGIRIDHIQTGKLLNCPITTTIGHKASGIFELKELILSSCNDKPSNDFDLFKHDLGCEFAEYTRRISAIIESDRNIPKNAPATWYATKILEKDRIITEYLLAHNCGETFKKAEDIIEEIEKHIGESSDIAVAEHRYGIISGLSHECLSSSLENRKDISNKIDAIVTNRVLGLPLFFILMYLVFWLTFTVGEPFMEMIESFFIWLSSTIDANWITASPLKSLVIDGAIAGVGGVVIFLPNIVLLFLAIAILEGTGYMARVAFIMDKIMHKLGLHGKSFIPMLIGFGCTIPAIMATRTLESRRDRMTTMLVAPLMSCGARLPIYTLIIPVFFPEQFHATIMWIIYLIGIILAIICAKILRSTLFKGDDVPFVMELPPYRVPTLSSIILQMWQRAWLYLRKAGTVILGISIILWIASTYPQKSEYSRDYQKIIAEVESSAKSETEKEQTILQLNNEQETERNTYTVLGRIGHGLEPALKYIGFDWQIGTALIGALAAKEVFVSQLGIVYSVGNNSETESTQALREIIGRKYSALQGFCIMLFCLITAPCMATIAVTRRESNSWKWAIFQLTGLTLLAYITTFIVYNTGMLLGY